MKKWFVILGVFAISILVGSQVDASLFQYFKESNLNLPALSGRQLMAKNCGIENYTGTAEQNVVLEECLKYAVVTKYAPPKPQPADGETLGVTPRRPTEYKSFLAEQKTQGHSNTTVTVTSVQTKDGFYIDPSLLGDNITLSINPGASNSETVKCTGLTTSTKQFSGCTFGYRFDDPLNTAPENILAHSPGEPVIISNPDTYLSLQFLSLDGTNIITGTNTWSNVQTFSVFPEMNRNVLPTTTEQFATKRYVDQIARSGAPTSTFTLGGGLVALATRNQIVSSTLIDAQNPLALSTGNPSVSFGYFVTSTCDTSGTNTSSLLMTKHTGLLSGDCVDGSFGYTWTASTTHTASTSFTGNAYNGVYMQNSTSTFATSTVLFAKTVSTTALFVSSTDISTIITASTSNAINYHYHPSTTVWGVIQKPVNDTTQTVVNHGLGVIPSSISFFGVGVSTANTLAITMGYATSTVASTQRAIMGSITGTTVNQGQQPAEAFAFQSTGGAVEAQGSVTAMTTQTFTITWDANSANGSSRLLIWSASK